MNGSQVIVSQSLSKSWDQYDNTIGKTLVIW